MKTQKILAGTLVSAIILFFSGWLLFGIVLGDFMGANCDQSLARPMDNFIWWSMILSNVLWGLLLCIVIYWRGDLTAQGGATAGGILGSLASLGIDFSMYSMSTFFGNPSVIIVDGIAMGVMMAAAGAVAAIVMSKVGGAPAALSA